MTKRKAAAKRAPFVSPRVWPDRVNAPPKSKDILSTAHAQQPPTSHADVAALRSLGISHYRANRLEEALQILSKITATAADCSNFGAVLRSLKRYTEAEAQYHEAIARQPDFAVAHYNLANLLNDLHRSTEAADSFRTAIRYRPDYADAWNGLGTTLQYQGHLLEAVAAFQSAIRLKPAWVEAHANLGIALLGLSHFNEAETALQHALEINPDFPTAHGNLGAV